MDFYANHVSYIMQRQSINPVALKTVLRIPHGRVSFASAQMFQGSLAFFRGQIIDLSRLCQERPSWLYSSVFETPFRPKSQLKLQLRPTWLPTRCARAPHPPPLANLREDPAVIEATERAPPGRAPLVQPGALRLAASEVPRGGPLPGARGLLLPPCLLTHPPAALGSLSAIRRHARRVI